MVSNCVKLVTSNILLFGDLMAFIKNHRGGWANEVTNAHDCLCVAVLTFLYFIFYGQQQIGEVEVSGFAYHPTLMVLAFQILAPEALLAFRTFDWVERPYRKRIHGALNGLFFFFAVRNRLVLMVSP
jgi:hypothetical protein